MPDDSNTKGTSNRHLAYRFPYGAQLLQPDRTHFRLWAPNADAVAVVLADGKDEPLQPTQGGWFETEINCGAGTRYRYLVKNKQGDEILVPDPASRAQVDSVHGDSIVVDPEAFTWKNPEWSGRPWHETVLYELHLGSVGGFRGAKERLSALAALGITGVELMPISSFPGPRNWGYDGVLPFAPQYTYGTPDELKALVDEAHSLGMTIFLDVVYNHFGPDGNYLNHYAPQFFDQEKQTLWGGAIDFTRPEVRNFFTQNVLYWLEEYRFDGLRFDACHAIPDQSWLFEIGKLVREKYQGKRHVHLMAENDFNSAKLLRESFTAQWNDDGHHVLHTLLTGEKEHYYADYAEDAAEKLARCLAHGFIYQGDIVSKRTGETRGEPSKDLPTSSFVFYLQNHDQIGNRPFGERLTTLVPDAALRAATALLLLTPHIPMLFMGEEFGATQPFLYFTSHNDELAKAVREGRSREFAGFHKFVDDPFKQNIPDPNHEDTFLASIPRPHSVVGGVMSRAQDWQQWISRLLGLRHRYIIPRMNEVHAISSSAIGPAAARASWQMADGSVLAIAINLSSESTDFTLAGVSQSDRSELILDHGYAYLNLENGKLPGYSFIALLEAPV